MKKIYALLVMLFISFSGFSQDISGSWNGDIEIEVQNKKIPVVFHFKKTNSGYDATMDSPSQYKTGVPIKEMSFENNVLKIAIPNTTGKYEATLVDGQFKGALKQSGYSFPLNLKRGESAYKGPNRPQMPKKPYPYISEDITFKNEEANITLAGTLTRPKGKGRYPAVVLINGSGPQDRDETAFGHKPFLVLADYLTRNGIAVLRFDERGVGKSTGKYEGATSYDLANDVECAFNYLRTRKEIHKRKIGLIGHSEGGMIAPIITARNKKVDFIVSMAGPTVQGKDIIVLQRSLIEKASGMSQEQIDLNKKLYTATVNFAADKTLDNKTVTKNIEEVFKKQYGNLISASELEQISSAFTGIWMRTFIQLDPGKYLLKTKCPILALVGGKDLQVEANQQLNRLNEIVKESGNKKVTTKVFKDLNHLFQKCEKGTFDEYSKIEQTIAPIVLETIANWITKQTK